MTMTNEEQRPSKELLPCPFCSQVSTVQLVKSEAEDFGTVRFGLSWYVCCDVNKGGCGGSGGHADDDQDAVRRWNVRGNVLRASNEPCPTHAAEHRARDTLPCPWCVIDELKRGREQLQANIGELIGEKAELSQALMERASEPPAAAPAPEVCVHGVRHPWACEPCDDAAWEAQRAAPPPEAPRLTDHQCEEIIAALRTYDWTGFCRDDIRLIAGTIHTYRDSVTKPDCVCDDETPCPNPSKCNAGETLDAPVKKGGPDYAAKFRK